VCSGEHRLIGWPGLRLAAPRFQVVCGVGTGQTAELTDTVVSLYDLAADRSPTGAEPLRRRAALAFVRTPASHAP